MRSKLPRVYELIDLTEDREHYASYFHEDFERSIEENNERQSCWLTREMELQKLDRESWEFLKTELFPKLAALDRCGRGWEQLFSILNQATAYNFLLEMGCSNIRFIPPESDQRNETPDLEGKLDGITVICEVKTMHISDAEVETRISCSVGTSLAHLEPGFFIKLDALLNKANSQMGSYDDSANGRHIVFVIINFDDSIGEYKVNYYDEIDRHLENLPITGIEVVLFNMRTCFHSPVSMKNALVVNEKG